VDPRAADTAVLSPTKEVALWSFVH